MDHCQYRQRAIRGPFQTCSIRLKPSNPMISMIRRIRNLWNLRWMILDPIDRSIDPRSNTPISTIWGLNLESCWHPSDAVLGVYPFGSVVTCGSAVMHLYWAIPIPDALRGVRTSMDPPNGSRMGPQMVQFDPSKWSFWGHPSIDRWFCTMF